MPHCRPRPPCGHCGPYHPCGRQCGPAQCGLWDRESRRSGAEPRREREPRGLGRPPGRPPGRRRRWRPTSGPRSRVFRDRFGTAHDRRPETTGGVVRGGLLHGRGSRRLAPGRRTWVLPTQPGLVGATRVGGRARTRLPGARATVEARSWLGAPFKPAQYQFDQRATVFLTARYRDCLRANRFRAKHEFKIRLRIVRRSGISYRPLD